MTNTLRSQHFDLLVFSEEQIQNSAQKCQDVQFNREYDDILDMCNLAEEIHECVLQAIVTLVERDDAQVCAVGRQVVHTLLMVSTALSPALCPVHQCQIAQSLLQLSQR